MNKGEFYADVKDIYDIAEFCNYYGFDNFLRENNIYNYNDRDFEIDSEVAIKLPHEGWRGVLHYLEMLDPRSTLEFWKKEEGKWNPVGLDDVWRLIDKLAHKLEDEGFFD